MANARRARGCAVGVLLALAPCALSPQSARPNTNSPEVRKLTLQGVHNVDPLDLSKSIYTQPSACKSFLLEMFCVFTSSPTFVDKHYLDETELARDIIRIGVYYWDRGYRNVQVDTAVTPLGKGTVGVTFNVVEGPPTMVARVTMEYDSTLLSERDRSHFTLLHARDPLNLVLLDSMRILLQYHMWDLGYGDAVADTTVIVDSTRKAASVDVRVVPNRRTIVGPITISGAQQVSPVTILNELTFKTEGLYRRGDVLESQRNLYESNLFRQATIYVPPQRDSVKAVEIAVTEAPLHDARAGVGLTSADFAQVQGHYTAFNFLGDARRLDLDATIGNLLASGLSGHSGFRDVRAELPDSGSTNLFLQPTWTASVAFQQPMFLGAPRNSLGWSAFAHRQATPGVFVDRGYGSQVSFTREVAVRAPISLNYRYELNRVEASDVYFCVDYGVCDTTTITALRSHQSLSPVSLTGFVDRSDNPFEPTNGYQARLELEHASALTGSDYRYDRGYLDAAVYTHNSAHNVFSAHLRLGAVRALASSLGGSDVLHPRKRFYAGGAQSVRGYGENQLGPRILTIAPAQLVGTTSTGGGACDTTSVNIQNCNPNTGGLSDASFNPQPLGGTSLLEGSVEYRVPLPHLLTGRFMVAAFVDGAIVGSGRIQALQDLPNITVGTGAITPGFGIRYVSPVGPVRFDIGINPKRSENLAVVTSIVENGKQRIVPLTTARSYSPGGKTLLDRMALHFSIGEAY